VDVISKQSRYKFGNAGYRGLHIMNRNTGMEELLLAVDTVETVGVSAREID